jgi:hypothetical protein
MAVIYNFIETMKNKSTMVIHGFLLNLQILHFAVYLLHDLTNCQSVRLVCLD